MPIRKLFWVLILSVAAALPIFKCIDLFKSSAAYFFEWGYQPDGFEYYLPAANLALYNKFPYYGFIGKPEAYNITSNPAADTYLMDSYNAGSMVFVSKPPLYSLLLGGIFKMFGLKPGAAVCLNFLSWYLTLLLLPWLGYIMQGYKGLLTGALAALLVGILQDEQLWVFTADNLTMFLTLLTYTAGVAALKYRVGVMYFLFGLLLGLLVLCKGFFIAGMYAICFWLMYEAMRRKSVKNLLYWFYCTVGMAIPMIIWMAYINPLLQSNVEQRKVFSHKLSATIPALELNNHNEIFTADGKFRRDVIENLNKFQQAQHALENPFIITTNQNGKYNILNVHNEYCIDGDFHPEWRIIKNSFYRQHIHLGKHKALLLFYLQNPLMGIRINVAKAFNVGLAGVPFYGIFFLFLCLIFTAKMRSPVVLAYIFISNIFIYIFILYGDVRFLEIVGPITYYFVVFVLLKFICSTVSYSNRPFLQQF